LIGPDLLTYMVAKLNYLCHVDTNELGGAVITQWTPEQRAEQAAIIRQRRPWEKSTGPRTVAGKMKASMNATKHGTRSRGAQALREAVRSTLAHASQDLEEATHPETTTSDGDNAQRPAWIDGPAHGLGDC
jgi:hypothetical protein